MKKCFFLPMLLLVATFFVSFTGCKKDEGPVNLSFVISNQTPGGGELKSTVPDIIVCQPFKANYVKAVIDGVEQKIATFYVNDVLYTNTIMVTAGQHSISEFTVWFDNNTPGNDGDDILLSATPHTSAVFAPFVQHPLDVTFSATSDKKTPVGIEVVCYQETDGAKFGFTYFTLEEVTIRNLNFFGDFCMKAKSQYAGSMYASQTNFANATGEYYDAPAIAKIEVWKKLNNTWMKQGEFTNSAQGETIKVKYSDYKSKVDQYELKLFILVKDGANFNYKYFMSWNFSDAETPLTTADATGGKTTYYCLGSCTPSANYILPGYLNLPPTASYKIVGSYGPGSLGAYVDAQISNVPAGYELANGLYASNCADHQTEIIVDRQYDMDVYNSMYPALLPQFARTNQWAQVNWLINHIGLEGTNNMFPGHTWSDLQGAIWLLDQPTPWNGLALTSVPNVTPMMTAMANAAIANFVNYVIVTGGWVCIVFVPQGTPFDAITAFIQTMFVRYDP